MPLDNLMTIPAEIHDAVMALPQDERRDHEKVNDAVRAALAGNRPWSSDRNRSPSEKCALPACAPERFACVSKKNPALEGKLERCKQQALDMGLGPGAGMSSGPALKNYVQAYMHRPG